MSARVQTIDFWSRHYQNFIIQNSRRNALAFVFAHTHSRIYICQSIYTYTTYIVFSLLIVYSKTSWMLFFCQILDGMNTILYTRINWIALYPNTVTEKTHWHIQNYPKQGGTFSIKSICVLISWEVCGVLVFNWGCPSLHYHHYVSIACSKGMSFLFSQK